MVELIHILIVFCFLTNPLQCAILKVGNPLSWSVSRPYLKFIHHQGLQQFLNHYQRSTGIVSPEFFWGDEIEYGIFSFNSTFNHYDLSLRSPQLRDYLNGLEKEFSGLSEGCIWQPEYGSWMIEAIPRLPYSGFVSDLLQVEKRMSLRRRRLHFALNENEIAPTINTFPMLGVKSYPHTVPNRGDIADSEYISDKIINPHPRFKALTQNIRSRRQSKVNIQVPCVSSLHKSGQHSHDSEQQSMIHMDAMAFGMGSCCLQITLQCRSEFESRLLADQLAILSPWFLALSASSPIYRGQVVDTDTRWSVISQAVDDRTPAERRLEEEVSETDMDIIHSSFDPALVGNGIRRLKKSRYSSVSRYIGQPQNEEDLLHLQELNDVDNSMDEVALQTLIKGGVDEVLASHIAHMYARDPLVIFDDTVPPAVNENDIQEGLDHFESIQSTNWRSVRWKPPVSPPPLSQDPPKSAATQRRANGPGWRVEFRPLEIQLTDFENAAYALLTVLSARCILAMGHSFYMPISLVDKNMERAQRNNAVMTEKFYVRRDAIRPFNVSCRCTPTTSTVPDPSSVDVEELTVSEFFNGQKEGFQGLIPAVLEYLDALGCDPLTKGRLLPYLHLLQQRASGTLPTAAQWIRQFIRAHPAQQGVTGSTLLPATADALLKTCDDLGMGKISCSELVGDAFINKLLDEFSVESDSLTVKSLQQAQVPTDQKRQLVGAKTTAITGLGSSSGSSCRTASTITSSLGYTANTGPGPSSIIEINTQNKVAVKTRKLYPGTLPYQPTSICDSGDAFIFDSKNIHLDAEFKSSFCPE